MEDHQSFICARKASAAFAAAAQSEPGVHGVSGMALRTSASRPLLSTPPICMHPHCQESKKNPGDLLALVKGDGPEREAGAVLAGEPRLERATSRTSPSMASTRPRLVWKPGPGVGSQGVE